jgi:hypothetical protein
MYNAFKKAFEKLLKNNLGIGHMWDFRTDKYFGFVSDEMIEVFSVDQEAGETAAVFPVVKLKSRISLLTRVRHQRWMHIQAQPALSITRPPV